MARRLDFLQRSYDWLKGRREAATVRDRQVRLARTAEESGGYYPTQPSGELPIVFLDCVLAGDSEDLDYTARSANAQVRALSPVGWLPPDVEVEVTLQGSLYRIVRAPATLVGKCTADIAAADGWVSGSGYYYTGATCDEYEVSRNTVQIFRKVSGYGLTDAYVQQRYSNNDAVTMQWANISDLAVTANKLLIATRNADNDWMVTVEPCGGICEDA